MDPRLFLSQSLHLLTAIAFGCLVLAGYRWIRRRSEVIGAIVAVTILGRAAAGLALFWTSYLKLPIAPALQIDGGFWQIAPDAIGYYTMATRVVDAGRLVPLDHAVPSPFFVDTLALWMGAVGVSPVAGIFLNLCLYIALAVIIVWSFAPVNDIRRDLPCVVGVGAYSFAPVILIHSTQPLKEELSTVLLAVVCFGVLAMRSLMRRRGTLGDVRAMTFGGVAVGLATFGTAGIRWYHAIIIVGSLVLWLAIFAVRWRTTSLPRYLAGSVALLMAAWLGLWGGAGPYYQQVGANINRVLAWQPPRDLTRNEIARSGAAAIRRVAAIPSDLMNMAQVSRTGFLTSGGNTNVIVPLREDPDVGLAHTRELEARLRAGAAYQDRLAADERRAREEAAKRVAGRQAGPNGVRGTSDLDTSDDTVPRAITPRRPELEFRAVPITVLDQLRVGAMGLGLVFVPISVLRAAFRVEMFESRGSLAIADLDTLFLDTATLAVVLLLWTRRRAIGDRLPFVVFAVILSATTAMLLGYVVTNYGTLWRMRPLVVIPLWLLVVALSPREQTRGA